MNDCAMDVLLNLSRLEVLPNAAFPFFAVVSSGGPPINGAAEDVGPQAVGVNLVSVHFANTEVVAESPEPVLIQPSGAVPVDRTRLNMGAKLYLHHEVPTFAGSTCNWHH